MTDLERLCGSLDLLASLNAALASRNGKPHRGWLMIDADSPKGSGALVHVRSWLRDPRTGSFYRIEAAVRPDLAAAAYPSYGIVFVAHPDGGMAPAGHEAVALAQDQGYSPLVVRGDNGAGLSMVVDGHWEPLAAA